MAEASAEVVGTKGSGGALFTKIFYGVDKQAKKYI
jgi:hypothetical protein